MSLCNQYFPIECKQCTKKRKHVSDNHSMAEKIMVVFDTVLLKKVFLQSVEEVKKYTIAKYKNKTK